MPEIDLAYAAQRSFERLRPRLHDALRSTVADAPTCQDLINTLDTRLADHGYRLFSLLHQLYGENYDFFYHLEKILKAATEAFAARPAELQELDRRRENNPAWYQHERMAGGSLYVDLFSGNLPNLRQRVPYLRDLGLTYIHLMPLFSSRPGNSDGGYAINDYRSVDPRLGTMEDLRALAAELRANGMSLVLDFVFNHTSDDHPWALRAQEGQRPFREFYHIFPDRQLPDRYEQNLREIFPTIRRGNFTWHEGLRQWVWTTFNSFQWDLNYANPEVFAAMAGEMLFLANCGVDVLRLDAVAFIWKKMGTSCENLPEAHLLIQAFNALCRIAAPALIFKSEAIVHPDEVARYISPEECQISYNPTLMALLWESTATRETRLLKRSLAHRHALPDNTAWVNYLRGHDDIGWSFDNGDASAVGIQPHDHRDFLNRFYTGRFEGSFARGIPFQPNAETGDMRVSGTMASLAGLEEALERDDPKLIAMALLRIRMLYGVLLSIGGIPLLFLGEEWGTLNDYTFADYPDRAEDSRWAHRTVPANNQELSRTASQISPTPTAPPQPLPDLDLRQPQFWIFQTLRSLLAHRRHCPALRGNLMRLLPGDNPHTLAFLRWHDEARLIVIANFSEKQIDLPMAPLRQQGLGRFLQNQLQPGEPISTAKPLSLEPYAILWLRED
jgi:amylosucrase